MDAFAKDSAKPKRIDISTRLLDQRVELRVADNGTGIAPEIAASMFELLRTSKDDGMGVGLWLSRTIVQAHQGYIDYETTLGQGTTFCVTMPVHHESVIY